MGVRQLRHQLLIAFLAATLLPLAAILWASSALMERSLAFVSVADVDSLAASLETLGREYYRQSREALSADARSGLVNPQVLSPASRSEWPPWLQHFWESGESERFALSEPDGRSLHYATRQGDEVRLYTRDLNGVRMGDIAGRIQQARLRVSDLQQRDLPRGFTLALVLAGAAIWACSLGFTFYLSRRISRPIQQLTLGLERLAAGKFDVRLESGRPDEIGRAIEAFNNTARELAQNRDRIVYLAQVASWQLLARKMAHELKNSLTPIRLTVEEIAARAEQLDPAFLERASAIVSDEVSSLERRVRAFSEFASEPEARPAKLDLNQLLEERIELLKAGHPGVRYVMKRAEKLPSAFADADQVRGILTNLLENAAEAAGGDDRSGSNSGGGDGDSNHGEVLALTATDGRHVIVEVHDSGPGLSAEARATLFEPTISFKKRGMGLGLAISRKNALLAGGDLILIEGRLGGAGFRLMLPQSEPQAARPGR